MKYGIMYYKETDNIGDDIQTYTARRFLPQIDYCIDREDLNCFIPKEKEQVAMIMNGWFLHNKAAWPPSPYIKPLLLSMHFTCQDKIDVGEKYLQGLGGDYLRQHQPIGARDIETQKRLTKNNIENYFSGCMTLTIQPFKNIKKQEYICVVDLDEKSTKIVKENTNRVIKEITHDVDPEEIKKKSFEQRMQDVEKLLKTYQAAHLVLTNRLHVALPCLALGVPVILVHKEHFESDRLGTYLKYVTSFSDKEFEKIDIKEILEKPKNNSNEYKDISNKLENACEKFIEICEQEKIDNNELPEIEEYKKYAEKLKWYQQLHEDIRKKAKANIYESKEKYMQYEKELKELKEYEQKYKHLADDYDKLKKAFVDKNQELDNIYQSKGWQLIEKIRKLRNKGRKKGE